MRARGRGEVSHYRAAVVFLRLEAGFAAFVAELLGGESNCSSNCNELLPAAAVPSNTACPPTPVVEGWRDASPPESEDTVVCEDERMTGIGLPVIPVSPIQTMGWFCGERASMDSNATFAPSTG